MSLKLAFGEGDASYRAAGELAGITALVDDFYAVMDTEPHAAVIRAMHPDDLSSSRQRLSYFLSGWLGGPRLYREHFVAISIPDIHKHLRIGSEERDQWLWCMQRALDRQDYPPEFKEYLLAQLSIPAERVRQRSQLEHAAKSG